MKISEVTVFDVAEFARIDDPNEIELKELEEMMPSAVHYIKSYTGLTDDELDMYEDLTIAYKILIVDMFDNRNLQMEKVGGENRTVKTILNMHSVNLL